MKDIPKHLRRACRCGDQKCPQCGDDKKNLMEQYKEEQAEIEREFVDWLRHEGYIE